MRTILLLPRILLGGLVLGAIATMLYGVAMRYIGIPLTDWLDIDPPNFFWVEEVGETALAWLTLIGAAIAVQQNSHFALNLFTHRLPQKTQHALHVFRNLLIAAFAALIAYLGVKLTALNAGLTSPALEISLGWLYAAAVAGGILMALYALDAARRPEAPHVIGE
jgi:hypothetical protein